MPVGVDNHMTPYTPERGQSEDRGLTRKWGQRNDASQRIHYSPSSRSKQFHPSICQLVAAVLFYPWERIKPFSSQV